MSWLVRHTRSERGQALVELALVTPILLVLIISVWEFARAWNIQQVITDAAREGARVSAIATASEGAISSDSVQSTVSAALGRAGVDPSTASVSVNPFSTGRGDPTTVTIALPYRFIFIGPILDLAHELFGGPGSNFDSTITLRTEVTMRQE